MNSQKAIAAFSMFVGTTLMVAAPVFGQEATQNIVEIAQGNDDLSTLVTAVTEANLVDTLSSGDANLTVFAPTNAAFDALPEGTLESLLANQDDLTSVLTYHVVDGEAFSGDLSDGQVLTTLQGETLTVTVNDEGVFINGNRVSTADVDATNGVVHVIDGVLIPDGIAEAHSPAATGLGSSTIAPATVAATAIVALSGLGLAVFGVKNYLRQE